MWWHLEGALWEVTKSWRCILMTGVVVCVRQLLSLTLWPRGLYSPWDAPDLNTGVRSLSLLQGIFPTQGLHPGLLHCRWILYQLSHKGSPRVLEWGANPFFSGSSQPRNQTVVSCIAGRVFTNWAVRESLIGVNAIMKRHQRAHMTLLLCKDIGKKMTVYKLGSRTHRIRNLFWSLSFLATKLVKNNCLLFSLSKLVVFFNSSPKKPNREI